MLINTPDRGDDAMTMTIYAEKLLPHNIRGRGGRPRLPAHRRRVRRPPGTVC